MNESGPIRKTGKELAANQGFCDYLRITANVWRVNGNGKYWLLKTAADDSAASTHLLRREFGILRELQHPFIVSVNRFEESGDKGPAIVMEYIAGRTLGDFIKEKPSAAKREKILSQILNGVEYLHRKGIIHNDIKPENILVTDVGDDVKIIDFGLSETDAAFLERRLGGTRGASAPEVLSGDVSSPSTAASDIYAIGGIIGLLFPFGYSLIIKKCHRINPEGRYRDIASLRGAIDRHRRAPWFFAAVVLLCALLAVSLLPYFTARQEIVPSDDTAVRDSVASVQIPVRAPTPVRTPAQISRVREDMEVFYNDAADSLRNPDIVPFQEFTHVPMNTFLDRTIKYKKGLPRELRPICDSVYARLVVQLMELAVALPRIDELVSRGEMSRAEEHWYDSLSIHDKPYEPYRK